MDDDLVLAIAVLNADWPGARAAATGVELPPWWRGVEIPEPAVGAGVVGLVSRLPVRVQEFGQRAALVVPWVARRVLLSAGVHNQRY